MGRGKRTGARTPGINLGFATRAGEGDGGIIGLSTRPRARKLLPDAMVKSLAAEAVAVASPPPFVPPAARTGTDLYEAPNILRPPAAPSSQPLAGQLICVTGKVDGYVRNDALDALTAAGAFAVDAAKDIRGSAILIVSGLTKNKIDQGLAYEKLPSKVKKAIDEKVRIIGVSSHAEFRAILNGQVI